MTNNAINYFDSILRIISSENLYDLPFDRMTYDGALRIILVLSVSIVILVFQRAAENIASVDVVKRDASKQVLWDPEEKRRMNGGKSIIGEVTPSIPASSGVSCIRQELFVNGVFIGNYKRDLRLHLYSEREEIKRMHVSEDKLGNQGQIFLVSIAVIVI